MSRSKDSPYHHGDLKRALLDAALEIIEAEGPEALTFRKLAEAVKVSHAAPLAHFPDRSSLDAAIATRACRRLGAVLASTVEIPPAPAPRLLAAQPHVASLMALPSRPAEPARPGPASRRLVAVSLAYIRFAIEHAGLYRAMYAPELAERLEPTEPHFRELVRERAQVFKLFEDLVEDGQRAGEFRKGVPADRIARLFLSLAEGLANQYIEEKPGSRSDQLKDAEQLFELSLQAVVNDLGDR